MVSTSCGSSISFTASIFFGSADNPLSLQVCPKKETFGSLCLGTKIKSWCVVRAVGSAFIISAVSGTVVVGMYKAGVYIEGAQARTSV